MPLRTKTQWFGVALDCPDPRELARFYVRLLGWQIFTDEVEWVTIAPSETTGYNLAFQKEPLFVAPTWPARAGEQLMQIHLDLEVDDLAQAVEFAVECGARLADVQPQDDVRVMLDPVGHPFCLYVGS